MSSQNKVALKFSERREIVKNSQYLVHGFGGITSGYAPALKKVYATRTNL